MQEQPQAEHKNEQTGDGHEKPSYTHFWDTEEQQKTGYQKAKEYFRDWHNKVSTLTLLFVAAYTLLTYCALRNTQDQTKISHQALAASQRPWIGSPVDVSKKESDGSVIFTLTFRNVGHSASKSLYIEGMLIDNQNWYGPIPGLCKDAVHRVRMDRPPFTAVPGSNWLLRLDQMPPKQKTKVNITDFRAMKNPFIVGCVAYTSPFDDRVHRTGYYVDMSGDSARPQAIFAVDAN